MFAEQKRLTSHSKCAVFGGLCLDHHPNWSFTHQNINLYTSRWVSMLCLIPMSPLARYHHNGSKKLPYAHISAFWTPFCYINEFLVPIMKEWLCIHSSQAIVIVDWPQNYPNAKWSGSDIAWMTWFHMPGAPMGYGSDRVPVLVEVNRAFFD